MGPDRGRHFLFSLWHWEAFNLRMTFFFFFFFIKVRIPQLRPGQLLRFLLRKMRWCYLFQYPSNRYNARSLSTRLFIKTTAHQPTQACLVPPTLGNVSLSLLLIAAKLSSEEEHALAWGWDFQFSVQHLTHNPVSSLVFGLLVLV